ncbi:ATP-binding protein [Psychrobacillus soli]|uniref:ATP-binding protein n=1 Tax=Psychrobacillus soli TaxID=1543965 RepID=A0A544SNG7_9BACI|nr:ATP-binding protein [Psychrobacillus soli]TQR06747.1 ATP-binding protein [Psychrobacillus soli]
MRIVFIWTEEYKKLKDFQTSFCGEFNIKYSHGKLDISKNNLYIENFFKVNGSNIKLNLSAIVGENGTGKSTILDLILDYIENGMFSNKYIVIFENDGDLFIDCNFEIFEIQTKEEIKYEIIQNESLDKYLKHQVTMFFSNVFDVRYFTHSEDIQVKENKRISFIPQIKNISTNALLANYKEAENFLNQDISKQIFFVNEYKSILEVEKLVKVPEKIYLKTNSLEYHYENLSFELEKFISAFDYEQVGSLHFNLNTTNALKEDVITVLTQSFCIEIGYLLQSYNLDDLLFIETYNNAKSRGNFFVIIHKNLMKVIKELESENAILKSIKKKLNGICKSYIELLDLIDRLSIEEDETV